MKKYWRTLINSLKKDELLFESITELDALFLRKNPHLNYQLMEFLVRFYLERKGWPPWNYIWLWISGNIACFYDCINKYFGEQGIIVDEQMVDLFQYQKDLMFTPADMTTIRVEPYGDSVTC